MVLQWVGAAMIIVACGGCGMAYAVSIRKEEQLLYQLYHVLQWMECELSCRAMPLYQVFCNAAQHCEAPLQGILESVSARLDQRDQPDAGSCILQVLNTCGEMPQPVCRILTMCGRSLGEFHLEGQLKELAAVRVECGRILEEYRHNRENRVRTAQVLGFSVGIALAIILY